MVEMPQIDYEKCNGCGLCISVCQCGALVLINDKVTIIETLQCHWCTECEMVCPTNAISCSFEIIME